MDTEIFGDASILAVSMTSLILSRNEQQVVRMSIIISKVMLAVKGYHQNFPLNM